MTGLKTLQNYKARKYHSHIVKERRKANIIIDIKNRKKWDRKYKNYTTKQLTSV